MKKKDFYEQMQLQEQVKRAGAKGSAADMYRVVRNHLLSFLEGEKISLGDLTSETVHSFQMWLQQKGLKVNTVNTYLSNLRAMYNRALRGRRARQELSPFAGLSLKREETPKRAVPMETIKKIASLDLKEEPAKQRAVDIALFSFFACGMAFVDIAHLTRENLVENDTVLQYHRQKTGVLIRMEISEEIRSLINRYNDPERRYLFPILPEGATHEQYKFCLSTQNHYMKDISEMLHLPEALTTYSFRHTWASEAYHKHIPIGVISQALGHTSEKTTRIYLSAFDVSEVTNANRMVSKGLEDCLMVG